MGACVTASIDNRAMVHRVAWVSLTPSPKGDVFTNRVDLTA